MVFRIHFFVSGKHRGSVLAEATNKNEAFAKAMETALYKRLNSLGWMVQWEAEKLN